MAGSEHRRPALPRDQIVPEVAAVVPGAGAGSPSADAVPSRYSHINSALALLGLPPLRLSPRGNHEVNVDGPSLQSETSTEPPEAGPPAAAPTGRPGQAAGPSTDAQPAAPGTEPTLAMVVPEALLAARSTSSGANTATTNMRSTPAPAPPLTTRFGAEAHVPLGISRDMTTEVVQRQEARLRSHIRNLPEDEARDVLEVASAFKCERCSITFEDVAALKVHYRDPSGPHHICVHCRIDFTSLGLYMEHLPTCSLYPWPLYPDPDTPDTVLDIHTGITRRFNVKRRIFVGSFLNWTKKTGPAGSTGGSSSSGQN